MEWQGFSANSTPQIKIDRKVFSVRRVIRELMGQPAKPQDFLVPSCANAKCVNPRHIKERTQEQHMLEMVKRVDHNNPLRIARLQKSKQHMRVLDDAGVALIRADSRKAQDLADELGCSKSLVNSIRRGVGYRQVNASANPFAGLMR
jgi:hypothetical protein